MPVLKIDNQEIEVAEGTKIIAAAELLGIMIPRFCYHPALGSVGACRVCAVKIENAGRLSGIQMSCMVDALDGMVVSTNDPEAVAFRKYVIEWLMLNHPHDCPVCDEGGHCLLQDMTVSGGFGLRRFKGRKRTYPDQYLGPLVQHEMNRCIQCYRCSRFYQEFAGYRDLGVMGIAGRVYFGRFNDGILENPFSGNLIDICPTGVYTDKPSRYNGRRWDYERSPGICIHCSLGCQTTVSARNREIVRQEAGYRESVNGHFICDRGRYGFYYANGAERPRSGRVANETVQLAFAVDTALRELEHISARHGASSIAAVGSQRSSLETLFALKSLCLEKGWQGPALWQDDGQARAVHAALSSLTPDLAVSLREIESADCILSIGTDVLAEAPMLALAIRQASRQGASVTALDPRPPELLDWPFRFAHLPVRATELDEVLNGLQAWLGADAGAVDALSHLPADYQSLLENTAGALSNSRKPVIICGSALPDAAVVRKSAALAGALKTLGKQSGLFYVLPRANSYGAALLDEVPRALDDVLERIAAGEIKALVAVESDMEELFHDQQRLASALEQLDLLVLLDCLKSDGVQRKAAEIHIPSQSIFEAGGIYVNQEGRPQRAGSAHAGGTPVSVTGGGGHPPRIFQKEIPDGDVPAPWQVLSAWKGRSHEVTRDGLIRAMTAAEPALANMAEGGGRLYGSREMAVFEQTAETAIPEEWDKFRLCPVASLFGDEPLSRRSECLHPLQRPPELWVSAQDAANLGIVGGAALSLSLKYHSIELIARVSGQMPEGVLLLPRLSSIFWQQMDDPGGAWISKDQIHLSGSL